MGMRLDARVGLGTNGHTQAIAALPGGGFVTAGNFVDIEDDFRQYNRVSVYGADGSVVVPVFDIVFDGTNSVTNIDVATLQNGNFLVYGLDLHNPVGFIGREYTPTGSLVSEVRFPLKPPNPDDILQDGRSFAISPGPASAPDSYLQISFELANGTSASPPLILFYTGDGSLADYVVLADGRIAALRTHISKADPVGGVFVDIYDPRNLTASDDRPWFWHGGNLADTITGGSGNDTIDGHAGDDLLAGGGGNDTLLPSAGTDTLNGGAGNDIYSSLDEGDEIQEAVDGGTDTIEVSRSFSLSENNVENLTLIGPIATSGAGNSLDNLIKGNNLANSLGGLEGNDTLDGGIGGDTMAGGDGDDVYLVDSAEDQVSEEATEGSDTVVSQVTVTLAPNVEALVLDGAAAIDGEGNSLDNVITGNAAANRINGGVGSDSMAGGGGDDTYVVDDVGDTVSEFANEGFDLVFSRVSLALSQNFEALELTGAASIDGEGNSLDNVITGNAAANRINGGVGSDTMAGGAGDDKYIVDRSADVVTEVANGGYDQVFSFTSYVLSDQVEYLALLGTLDLTAGGNGQANRLVGNSGDNTINGHGGNDTMVGGAGDDLYYAGNGGVDSIIEGVNGGEDTVFAFRDITLSQNVEDAVLKAGVRLTGNASNNTLTGNSGDNILNGGTGVDTMAGGAGDDTYYIGSSQDHIVEKAAQGIDVVRASADFGLSAGIENLVLTGSAHIGSGNGLSNEVAGTSLANRLSGAGGDDALRGYAGDDTLAGGTGNDTLSGGTGHDTFVFNTVPNGIANSDRVSDFSVANDLIALENSIFTHAGPAGVLAAFRFYAGTGAHDLNDRIIYDPASGALLYDADGSGGEGAFRLATLNAHLALTNADFLIT
ncbi:hypothetical protein BH10PSE7_BH10PSE7_26230 [soil metagenome]